MCVVNVRCLQQARGTVAGHFAQAYASTDPALGCSILLIVLLCASSKKDQSTTVNMGDRVGGVGGGIRITCVRYVYVNEEYDSGDAMVWQWQWQRHETRIVVHEWSSCGIGLI
jgi:hypothetical protein